MPAPAFRHRADRWPTAFAVFTTLVTFVLYIAVDELWIWLAYSVAMLVPRGSMCAWNHHHQHCFTFRSTALNRGLELCYALHTGLTTNAWLLHHVLGHHQNFLDQTKDESRWQRRDGTQMGLVEYTVMTALTAYWRAYQVGLRYPQHQRPFLLFSTLTAVLVVALTVINPVASLVLFVGPMLISMLWTTWATYDHHSGLPTDSPWAASYNMESPLYNWLTCNLGYHTAHHHRPGVHWSKLPELHRSIRHKIPPHLIANWHGIGRRKDATAAVASGPDAVVTPIVEPVLLSSTAPAE